MSNLDRQVRRVRSRLLTNTLMERAAWGVLIAATAWSLLWLIERVFQLGVPFQISLIAAGGVAAVFTIITTLLSRPSSLLAAVTIDKAAGLKERVSTAIAIPRTGDPWQDAAIHDAERVAASVHVPTHVPMRAPIMWPWSVATVVAAALLAVFMPALNLFGEKESEKLAADDAVVRAEHEAIDRELRDQADRIRKLAEGNPALAALTDKLDALKLPDMPDAPEEDMRRDALARIKNVANELQEKQQDERVAALQKIKEALQKDFEKQKGDDAAAKLSQALAEGDTKAAKEALEDLKKQMREAAENVNDEAAKQKLAEMQEKLEKMAEQIQQMDQSENAKKDLQHKGGMSQEQAEQLMKKMEGMDAQQMQEALQKALSNSGMSEQEIKQLAEKIAQNQQMRQQLQQMAQQMQQAAQACQQCQKGGQEGQQGAQSGAQALDGLMDQLSEMEMAEQMMNDLQAQMSELRKLGEQIGEGGFGQCEKPGEQPGGSGNQYGKGYGAGAGKERSAFDLKNERADTKYSRGRNIGKMEVDAGQLRGMSIAQLGEAVPAVTREAQEAIERDEVPPQFHRLVQGYFESLAGLQSDAEKKKAEPADEPAADKP